MLSVLWVTCLPLSVEPFDSTKSSVVAYGRFLGETQMYPSDYPGGMHLLDSPNIAAISGSSECKRHVLESLARYSNTL